MGYKQPEKTMLKEFESRFTTVEEFVEHIEGGDSVGSVADILVDVYALILDTMTLIEDKKDDPEVKQVISDVEQLLADL